MNLLDFKSNKDYTFSDLKCRLLISKKILSVSGRVQYMGDNHFKMIMGEETYEFMVIDSQDAKLLSDKMKQYTYNLVQVSHLNNNSDDFSIHIVFFYEAKREIKLNIVLSQKVKKTLIDKHLARENRLEDDVRENFMLTDGTNDCYAYARGKYRFTHTEEMPDAVNDDSDSDSKNEETADKMLVQDNETENEFISIKIFGKDYSILVNIRGTDTKMFLCAESIDTKNRYIPPLALRIGTLTFKDEEALISERIKKELEITSGYLDIWDKYTSIEGDFLLKKARYIGIINIDRSRTNKGEHGLIVYPEGLNDKQKKMVSVGDYILISEDVPEYISDDNMSWIEYKQDISAKKELNVQGLAAKSFKIRRIDRSGYWVIEADGYEVLPPGIVTYSVYGDMQQILRREAARELIENGEAAYPSLGLVIEGKKSDSIISINKEKKIEPITAFVKEKIFSHEPRPRQRDAIEIALNTPDIAIIQGPPGTGKTTVITAIIERLNELADKRKDNRGQVLITSFQHDAVRNVIGRLSINSLPTIKFGKQGDDDVSQEQAIEKWCYDYAIKLKERNPSIQQTAEQKEFERKHNSYLLSPNDSNALLFLEYAQKVNSDNDINELIERLIREISASDDIASTKIIEKIRRIRCAKESFLDDGADTADDLLAALEEIMDEKFSNNARIFSVLQEAADCIDCEPSETLLQSLHEIKYELLNKCTPRLVYRIEKPREDILDIYSKIVNSLNKPQNAEAEILFNLLSELENNSLEVEKMVAGYNFVYAATAQQSEGKDIKRAKNINKWDHPVYDTVIIDEAARVNPGDLMIPMSQATRRIILVGDHRQLPHIYDEEIFESMRDNGNDVGKDVVKISMFQYLKEKAEQLYKCDGIPRAITLDAQYRMHPVLGDFVNQNFYEPYGEGFESPLPASVFEQKLYDKPFMWVDMSNSRGEEEKDGTSRLRRCEAKYIVDKLREYILSDAGKHLTYGVITFYSAQAKLIKRLLKDKDISENVRVGSVDAFQGMEFDVIFLSVVRTHSREPVINEDLLGMEVSNTEENSSIFKEWSEYKEGIGLKYYGFLTSENRLCVALSRQKKLLIVVGDSAIFSKGKWDMVSEKCVPAMRNFLKLCEDGGAVKNA